MRLGQRDRRENLAAEGPDGAGFLKVGPEHEEWVPGVLAQRLDVLAAHVPVPTVLFLGVGDDGPFLHSAALPGRDGARAEWWEHAAPGLTRDRVELVEEAEAAVGALVDGLARALRAFHEAVPVDECPWVGDHEGTARLEPGEAVVCHGDACIPNLLLAEVDGRLEPSGYVDLPAPPGRLAEHQARRLGLRRS